MIFCHFRDDVVALERIAHEFCEDQASSGVLYCEVRYCPHLLCTAHNCMMNGRPDDEDNEVPNMLLKKGVSPRDVVQAVCRGLHRGERDFGVKVRSILCCMRPEPGNNMFTFYRPLWVEKRYDWSMVFKATMNQS